MAKNTFVAEVTFKFISILIPKVIDSTWKSKRFFSPAYKHLKGTFAYTRNEKDTQLKKSSNT